MAFTNPARKDGLVLYHWRRSQDEGKDYPFARWLLLLLLLPLVLLLLHLFLLLLLLSLLLVVLYCAGSTR